MSERWPSPLKIEVKISRSATYQLSKRELKGLAPDGYLAVLITQRLLRGPRWVFVPAIQLQPRGYGDDELCMLGEAVESALCCALNHIWSNWILDVSVWEKLFHQDHMKIKNAIDWCLRNHPPRENKSVGNLREGRLADSLRQFRNKLDRFQTGDNCPQQEGFIHQYLLAHGLEVLGYRPTVNPVGVPDISAIWTRAKNLIQSEREKLLGWQPRDHEMKELRDFLLKQSDETLCRLRNILGGLES